MNTNRISTPNAMRPSRPTIGFLVDDLTLGYQQTLWQNVLAEATRQDVNLVTVAALAIQNDQKSPANFVYDLVGAYNLDGLIIATGTLFANFEISEILDFVDQYHPISMISIAVELDGIPSLVINNKLGMYQAVSHLISDHGYRKIAFTRQFAGNPEAEDRYQAYVDALTDHEILFDPNLVTPPNYDEQPAGAVKMLLDERQVEIDAIVTVDDNMAIQIIEELQARGVQVPSEIAVVGFDNIEESQYISPALTTVHQPIAQQGQMAVALLLQQIAGEKVSPTTILDTQFMPRQSCGCVRSEQKQFKITHLPIKIKLERLKSYREKIIGEMVAATRHEEAYTWVTENLLDAFLKALDSNDEKIYLETVERIFTQVSTLDKDTQKWQKAIQVLWEVIVKIEDLEGEARIQSENWLHQTRTILAETSQRNQAQLRITTRKRALQYREWGQTVSAAPDFETLKQAVIIGLPTLGVPGGAIVLDNQPDSDYFNILVSFSTQASGPIEGLLISKKQVIPENFFPVSRPASLVLQPLYFNQNRFGYLILEFGPLNGSNYKTIEEHISSAIQNINLFSETQTLLKRTNSLYQTGRNLIEGLSLEDAIQIAADGAANGMGADIISINVINFKDKEVEHMAFGGPQAPKQIEKAPFVELLEGLTGIVLKELRPVFSPKTNLPDPRESAAAQKRRGEFGAGSLIIVPLQYRGELLGTMSAINKIENRDFNKGEIDLMMALASQAAAAILNAKLFQQMETNSALNARRAIQLETAAEVAQAISTLLDIDELLPRVVDVLQEHFGLYYCGLFLVDRDRAWAELKAGTGEPGKKLLEQSWKLEVGGNSMIGRCIRSGKPDIQLSVDSAPIHLQNPYLPDTRSEMALPLINRGEIIGAISIQSTVQDAFSPDDAATLQTMANQLANAIENSRLFSALAQEQTFMNALMENLPDAIYFKNHESRFMRVSQHMIEKYTKGETSEILGKTDFDLFTQEHAQSAFEDEQHIIKTGIPLLNSEEVETFEDRPDAWVLTSKLPLHNEKKEIIGTFGISRDITAQKRIEQIAENRLGQLQGVAVVTQTASAILDLDNMMPSIVELIRDRFDLHYVGIFLSDDDEKWAILKAGTGEAGKAMLNKGWKLKIQRDTMIGNCIITRKADIQLDIDLAPVHLQNPYLPETRSEIALPLISRGNVLGALSIQSIRANAFATEDAVTLQIMADQIASAIQNTRLYEQTQTTLSELQTAQRRYLTQAWSEYNQRNENTGFKKVDANIIPLGEDVLPEVQQAMQVKRPVIIKNENAAGDILAVPILLRDEPIGALGFNLPAGKKSWTKDDIIMAEAVSEQFGLAAETLRLLDDTQKQAARERFVTEITTKIRATNDPQAMLTTALLELRAALKTEKAQVLLQPKEND